MFDDAIEHFEKAIKLNPQESEPYHMIGELKKRMNLYEDAIEYYEKAI